MRVVLADVKSDRGFVSKDTVVGGYGSRLDPFSRVTTRDGVLKKQFHDVPSVHMAYIAAILARAGHEVTVDARRRLVGRRRRARAVVARRPQERDRVGRSRCARAVSRSGSSASRRRRCPSCSRTTATSSSNGEPEAAVMRLAQGERPVRASSSASRSTTSIRCRSRAGIWSPRIAARGSASSGRRGRSAAAIPLLASRGCPEFCTYCPHRILAGYRARSIGNIVGRDGAAVRSGRPRPYVIFRDPLFSEQRDRVPRAVRRDPGARPDAHLRGRDAARPARRRAARQAARGGIPRDELRRRVARPGDAEEVGAPADSAGAPARDHRALPPEGAS